MSQTQVRLHFLDSCVHGDWLVQHTKPSLAMARERRLQGERDSNEKISDGISANKNMDEFQLHIHCGLNEHPEFDDVLGVSVLYLLELHNVQGQAGSIVS